MRRGEILLKNPLKNLLKSLVKNALKRRKVVHVWTSYYEVSVLSNLSVCAAISRRKIEVIGWLSPSFYLRRTKTTNLQTMMSRISRQESREIDSEIERNEERKMNFGKLTEMYSSSRPSGKIPYSFGPEEERFG